MYYEHTFKRESRSFRPFVTPWPWHHLPTPSLLAPHITLPFLPLWGWLPPNSAVWSRVTPSWVHQGQAALPAWKFHQGQDKQSYCCGYHRNSGTVNLGEITCSLTCRWGLEISWSYNWSPDDRGSVCLGKVAALEDGFITIWVPFSPWALLGISKPWLGNKVARTPPPPVEAEASCCQAPPIRPCVLLLLWKVVVTYNALPTARLTFCFQNKMYICRRTGMQEKDLWCRVDHEGDN